VTQGPRVDLRQPPTDRLTEAAELDALSQRLTPARPTASASGARVDDHGAGCASVVATRSRPSKADAGFFWMALDRGFFAQ
jgi:hypothetical protein